MSDLPNHLVDEIEHFFEVYKVLEPEKHSNVRGWEGVKAAIAEIEDCRQRYADTPH
jgi:inorganic pyrophosphatase